MIATNPITIDGETYDRYSVNLAISGKYGTDGNPEANIAMRLIPARIGTDGNGNPAVIEAPDAAIGILRGRFSEISDPDELAAVQAISAALQGYVTAKGL